MRYSALCCSVLSLLAASCSPSLGLDQTQETEPPAEAVVADSDSASKVLGILRARHEPQDPHAVHGAPAAVPTARLFERSAFRWQRTGERLQPRAESPTARRAALSLPAHASGAFHLEDTAPLTSGASSQAAAIDVQLRGANDAEAETAEGYVVYRAAGPSGATLLQRPTDDGTEDYLSFERAPDRAEVVYDVALGARIAGLRLVANTLELLDAEGDPRLRVAPPYVVGADGKRLDAELSVAGCAVDRDPAPPWDRAPLDPGARRCEVHVRWERDDVTYPAVLDPSWTSTGSMISARAFAGSATLSDGRVLMVGGTNASGTPLASAELYNPTTRTWSATGSMSAARTNLVALRMNNSRVLVVGGQNSSGAAQSAALQYSPSQGAFLSAGTMLTARGAGLTATLLGNDKVLVAGGNNASGAATSSAELYTPSTISTGTWAATGNMVVAQTNHRAALLSTGRVLLVGAAAPSAQLYNVTTGAFSTTGALAVPRSQGTLTVLSNGNVLYAGGNGSNEVATTCELYNPTAATWSRVGSFSNPRLQPQAIRLADGRVLLTGSSVGGPNPTLGASELYNPTWGVWVPGPEAATPRVAGHALALLSNNRVLVTGGYSTGLIPTSAAEEFIPTTTATTSAEYRFAPAMDPEVTTVRPTEIWAAVYRPTTLAAGTRYPLIIFLHGNHRTCGRGSNPRIDDSWQYTDEGVCTGTSNIVVPNHAGYAYTASELATRGYIVVSINANRINSGMAGPDDDWGMNLARGRLVLKHLQRLSQWDRGVVATPASLGVSLNGKLDLNNVGLMGHSRGGEGMRAAHAQYRDPGSPWPGRIVTPVNVRGIFEIGPVDGQSSRVLNADSTKWTVLLPMCDGDVFDLSGVRVLDRMMIQLAAFETLPTFKASYLVYGANHNFYNTEWQQNESTGCTGTGNRAIFVNGAVGSPEQRQTGVFSMLSFFGANVGPATTPVLNRLFDPRYATIQNPRVDRGYIPAYHAAYSVALEDFNGATGTSSFNVPNQHSGAITVTHRTAQSIEHDPAMRVGEIRWTSASTNNFFQSNFKAVGTGGYDISFLETLDLRVTRLDDALNPASPTDFEVRLVNGDNTLSGAASLASYVKLDGPAGAFFPGPHSVLQTARIPLSAFSGATLTSIRGVRLTFSSTSSGRIMVAKIRGSREPAGSSLAAARSADPSTAIAAAASPAPVAAAPTPAEIAAAPIVAASVITGNPSPVLRTSTSESGHVEVELTSTTAVEVGDELPILQIGGVQTGRLVAASDDWRRVVFRLPRTALDTLAGGEPISVRYGRSGPTPKHWKFGVFNKAALPR